MNKDDYLDLIVSSIERSSLTTRDSEKEVKMFKELMELKDKLNDIGIEIKLNIYIPTTRHLLNNKRNKLEKDISNLIESFEKESKTKVLLSIEDCDVKIGIAVEI